MTLFYNPAPEKWNSLTARPQLESDFLESTVCDILNHVKNDGDAALRALTLQFDKVNLTSFLVSPEEIKGAEKNISVELKKALYLAKENIEKFHNSQRTESKVIETMPGVTCWRKPVAINKVGLYIPGGTAPLFSTVLMLGIPARLAGCREVVLCSPPDPNGKIHPAILFTATLVGITKIYKLGGAQAIAAMAYGTESVPKVYKIFGPGNQFVTMAKQLVNRQGMAIDMPAGPSEVLIMADETANASFIAADLLSQAEHGADSQTMLVLTSDKIFPAVQQELEKQVEELPRKNIARQALANSRAVVFSEIDQAIAFVNEYAPEHLIINMKDDEHIANEIINAGSVFLGNYSPEAAGDYASGTNHTLPTNGYAKSYSGVSLDSFVKCITYQRITEQGIQNIGNTIECMAEAEQLIAHRNAVQIRLNTLQKNS